MTPEQFNQFINKLGMIVDQQPYTITGAADWPILLTGGSIVFILGGIMWKDLRNTLASNTKSLSKDISDLKSDMTSKFEQFERNNDREHDFIKTDIIELKRQVYEKSSRPIYRIKKSNDY